MTIVESPPRPTQEAMTEPPAPSEQELIYEWFREQYWTEEIYLALSDSTNRRFELSGGKLLILPMPTLDHQNILLEFASRVKAWLEQKDAGKIVVAPHPIRLWPGKYREPDVMIWLKANLGRLGKQESGPPDLVLEILSPTTARIDSDLKSQEYAQAGISEYWMIDPKARRVSVFTLEGRAYKLLGDFGSGERARSNILTGFEVAVDDLFREQKG
ncbi:MAG: Uma2 family endonuclease [Chloroflexota bacterium]